MNRLAACGLGVWLLAISPSFGQINWDGGDGDWSVDTKWNGGMTADEVLGRRNGFQAGGTEVSDIVNIASGNVTYDPNIEGDFRFRGSLEMPVGTLNLSGGASLSMNSNSDVDGKWTQFDGVALNIDNATLRRTQSGSSNSGGALIFGSWNSYENQSTSVTISNGGVLDNHGQVWFGAWDDNAVGLAVNMTINNGRLDLKGGYDQPLGPNLADADLVFIHGSQGYDATNGGGTPKNEKYSINFTGPGSISVSEAGIINAVQDEFGSYNDTDITQRSYQDLWNAGILQAHGFSGTKGAGFNGFFTVEGNVGENDYLLTSKVATPVPVVWDGGDGTWNDEAGKWNGGQTAQAVLGRKNGLEVGSGEIGFDVHINSGNVAYDPNANGDLRFKSGGSLNLSGGATLSLDTVTAPDGYWTEFDGDAINIDNATLRRTKSGEAFSGGALILGSWRTYTGQEIEVNLTNGGSIENDGQLWFGAWGDTKEGMSVVMTINDGFLDLTGGNNYDLLGDGAEEGGPGNADLVFIHGHDGTNPKNESYVINFTGPGSITVDSSGIVNAVADGSDGNLASYGTTLTTLASYEDLWNFGILRANGMSGLDGATFADFFSTIGTVGMDDYTLNSLLSGGIATVGDCNGDGMVDAGDLACIFANPASGTLQDVLDATGLLRGDFDGNEAVEFADFLVLSSNFGTSVTSYVAGDIDGDGDVAFSDFLVLAANFGQGTAQGALASVPEPSGLSLGMVAFSLIGLLRRRR